MIRRCLIGLIAWLLAGQPAWAACALDGTNGSAFGSGGATTFTTGPISTTNKNDLILIVESNILLTGSGFGAPTGVTGGGLIWHQRGASVATNLVSCGSGCALEVSLWWAAASAPLTNQTFTLAMNATWQSNGGYTHAHVFALSGLVNPAAPWDVNASLPATATNPTRTPSAMTVTGISTSNANDVLLAVCSTNDASGPGENCNSPPVGPLTEINNFRSVQAFVGLLFNSLALYQPLAAKLSGASVNFNNSSFPTTIWWAALVDAVACTTALPPQQFPNVWIHE